jgi:hypothetical protein
LALVLEKVFRGVTRWAPEGRQQMEATSSSSAPAPAADLVVDALGNQMCQAFGRWSGTYRAVKPHWSTASPRPTLELCRATERPSGSAHLRMWWEVVVYLAVERVDS